MTTSWAAVGLALTLAAGPVGAAQAGTPLVNPIAIPGHPDTTVLDVSLSAGRVTWLDGVASPFPTTGDLWQRTVSRSGAGLTAGPEIHLSTAPTSSFYTAYSATSFSAGRGAADFFLPRFVVEAGGGTRLVERGAQTGEVPVGLGNVHRLRTSGPYVVADEAVLRADGVPVFDLPPAVTSVDLYGAELVYGLADGSVVLRDLTEPVTAAPVTLAAPAPGMTQGTAPQVAVWDRVVAWSHDRSITIRTLPPDNGTPNGTAVTRTVTAPDFFTDLRLSEGALSWSSASSGGLWAVDLKQATSTPVPVPGLSGAEVDDHLAAGIDPATGLVTVRPLPFGQATNYPPRLVGVLAPPAFSARSSWTPQIDLSKPAMNVRLALTGPAGTPVRQLTGTAPDGSVRDLVWDGKDTTGAPLPPGTYRWSLTADAADGEGALVPATGTVRLLP